jgi:hypothetical protein
MGLTVYYDWKIKADYATARRLIKRFHKLAQDLPFDHLSEIFEQDPPHGETPFTLYDDAYRRGTLFLGRKRADGGEETVQVPATRGVFFQARIDGAETVEVGLAMHPPVVVHREDVIEVDEQGRECGRVLESGNPIEFPTRRRGYLSWRSFCKTQYAGSPKLGGEANFLRAHLTLIELLDQIGLAGAKVRIRDDSGYARHRNVDRLLRSLREWNGIIANIAGSFKDALGGQDVNFVAPIMDRPDFEHLEADGVKFLKRLAARQRRRKRKG